MSTSTYEYVVRWKLKNGKTRESEPTSLWSAQYAAKREAAKGLSVAIERRTVTVTTSEWVPVEWAETMALDSFDKPEPAEHLHPDSRAEQQ